MYGELMSRIRTAGSLTRLFGALLVFVLLVAAVPHCAMACCEGMPAKGTLPTAAAQCSGPCGERNATIATSPQSVIPEASFSPPLLSALAAAATNIEPPATVFAVHDGRTAAPSSVAIYLRDASLLI